MFHRLKIAFSLLGLLLAIIAIALDKPQVTWAAIAMLAASVAMRVVIGRQAKREGRGEEPSS